MQTTPATVPMPSQFNGVGYLGWIKVTDEDRANVAKTPGGEMYLQRLQGDRVCVAYDRNGHAIDIAPTWEGGAAVLANAGLERMTVH